MCSFKSEELFVDGRTGTETGFIRSSQRRATPSDPRFLLASQCTGSRSVGKTHLTASREAGTIKHGIMHGYVPRVRLQ